MAVLQAFGNTWWGQNWLDALRGIDYSNRLPRGKSYARNGHVVNIQIKGNVVNARVQGTRRTPYRETVSLNPFTQKQKKIILDVITGNPLYLSRLLMKELPDDLYEEFESRKIRLFPESWHDLNASCSCPDWAVPCKHLAAVIYMIANEIDRNPFLIFELHGLDILEELRQAGYEIGTKQTSQIKSLKQVLENSAEEVEQKDASLPVSDEILNRFDFSKIPFLRDELLNLLTGRPLLNITEDFKTVLKKAYIKIGKSTEKFLENGLVFLFGKRPENVIPLFVEKEFSGNVEEIEVIDLTMLNDYISFRGELKSAQNRFEFDQNQIKPLFQFLNQIPSKRIKNFPRQIVLYYLTYNFALSLLKQGAFVPELFLIAENTYRIRWIPALLNPIVKEIFDNLKEILPPDTVKIGSANKKTAFKTVYPQKDEQLLLLISIFLDYLIAGFCRDLLLENQIRRLFFNRVVFSAENFEDQQIPETIHLWLSRFFISHKNIVPVLKISDMKKGFQVEIFVENKEKPLEEPFPLKDVFTQDRHSAIKMQVLKDLSLLSDFFPHIRSVIASRGTSALVIPPDQFSDIFFNILPIIKLLGIQVLLPKGLQELIYPKLSLLMAKKSTPVSTISYLTLDEMLSFEWKIALGDQTFSAMEFLKMVRGMSGIVRIKDRFVWIHEEEIDRILQQLKKQKPLTSRDLLKVGLEESYNGSKILISDESRKVFQSLLKTKSVSLPKGLKGRLRQYQKRGYEWLFRNAHVGFGSIIADDMGLGKTVQVLSVLLKLKNQNKLGKRKALVIVPTTLITNWRKEIEKFAPGLKSTIYHGLNRKLELDHADILLTTYGIVRNETALFTKRKWLAVIIDEAQNIKNPNTAQTKAIKKINADVRIAMSGTPVENRLTEYWSIFDFVNKDYLGGLRYFKKEYAIPIEKFRDKERLNRLLTITSPFVLRRLKSDKRIIRDLPEKLEFDKYCSLTKEQAALYQNVIDQSMASIEGSEGIARKGMVLKLMTALKQICNHPAHFLKKKEADPNLSGKTSMLLDLLENIFANDEKVLIFTQYRQMGNLLVPLILNTFQMDVPFLHGGVPRKKRDEMVDDFQEKKYIKAMILSLKAGGTGLNLTAAKNVIHFDLWWNPAVETQATDRTYRIGQKKDVMVYRFLTQGTFEEKINDMLQRKKEVAELAVVQGEKWIGDLSNKEIRKIVELGA